jgi:hypothetical protein
VRRDPRLSLTVLAAADWYTHVSLVGRVVELRPDQGLVDIDRLSNHYAGRDYRNRESPRTSAWMTVEKWHGWGQTRT